MTKKQPHDFELSRFLPYRVDRLATRVSQSLARLYTGPFGLTVPDWRALVWLHHLPTLTARDIVARTHMDKATVSRAVQRLDARGLISKAADPADQRIQVLALTAKGRALLARLLPRVEAWEQELLAGFTAPERTRLLGMLDRLDARLTSLEQGGDAEP